MSGARRSGRGMRPARGNKLCCKKLNVMSMSDVEMMDNLDNFPDGLVVKRNAGAVSRSADAEVFSPEAVPSGGAPIEEGPESDRTYGHPREMAGEVFGRNYAVGLTPAVFAGVVAAADLAGTDFPAIAEKEFSAVVEAWSLANDAEGSPSVIHVSKQLRAVVEDILTVPAPIEHSVDKTLSEEGSSPVN